MVPNLEYVVWQVRNSQSWDFTTKAGLCQYSNAVVEALYKTNNAFGHLSKTEAQNHCIDSLGRRHAVDVTLYLLTGQVVDFIASAGYGNPPPPNDVTWNEGPIGEYPASSWFSPVDDDDPPSGNLEDRVTELEVDVEVLNAQVIGLQSQITELAHQISDMHQLFVVKPLPDYFGIGRLFGISIPVTSKPIK